MADAAVINLATGTAPSAPTSGKVSLYAKANGKVYKKVSAGVETTIGAGGGEPLTNGSLTAPELVFSQGDVVMITMEV
jgi:hypothetical protein